jgi:hypothetical protein
MPGGFALLAPLGLAALVALAAILIIHMRRRTPPTITLPSLRFWDPVDADHADKHRIQWPPITLALLLQLLAALALALALARPVLDAIPGLASQRSEPANTVIVLDGSTSMLAQAQEGDARTRWDLGKTEVLAELDAWQPGDVVTLVVGATQSTSHSASTSPQVETIRATLRAMEAPGGRANMNDALELASHLLLPNRQNRVLLVTDGAIAVDPAIAQRVTAPIDLRIVGDYDESLPNVAVTAIGSRVVPGTDGQTRLAFSLTSFASDAVRLPYRVQADGVDIVTTDIDLAGGETRPVELTLPLGARSASVAIDVRDPFQADNSASLLLDRAGSTGLNILLISDTPGPLERALTALPEATVDTFPAATPGIRALSTTYDLTVFEGVSPSPDDVPSTAMMLVRPSPLADRFTSTGVLASPTVERLDPTEATLQGVDFAGVTFGSTPVYQLASGEELLARGSAGGQTGPLLWRGDLDGVPYIALGFDLATSNITERVTFPILIARSVESLTAPPVPGAIGVGDTVTIAAAPAATTVQVSNPLGRQTEIAVSPGAPAVMRETGRSGIYTFSELTDGGQVLAEYQIVVNAGSLAESNLRPNPDLATSLTGGSDPASAPAASSPRSDLWPLLAAIALVVIAAEWLVVRAQGAVPVITRWRPGRWRREGVA